MLAVEEMVLKENKMLRDEGRKIGISVVIKLLKNYVKHDKIK